MLKEEFLKHIAEEAGVSRKQARAVLHSVTKVMETELAETGVSGIPGLLTVKKAVRSSRNCRNPQTGEAMVVSAKEVLVIKSTPLSKLVCRPEM